MCRPEASGSKHDKSLNKKINRYDKEYTTLSMYGPSLPTSPSLRTQVRGGFNTGLSSILLNE